MKENRLQKSHTENIGSYDDELITEKKLGKIKRRSRFNWLSIILPVVLGIALIGTLIWGISRSAKAAEYKNAAQSLYSRAYSELVSELSELEVVLSKLQIVGTKPQYILLLDDVWKSCGTCTGLLSQIPESHIDSTDMNRFLVRVGDYAHSLSTKLLHGEAMTSDDTKQLSDLRTSCSALSNRLLENYKNGTYPDDILGENAYFESSSSSYEGDETRQDYPTLIYDGPFSESAEKAEPKGLTGNNVSQVEAYSAAMSYIQKPCNLEFSSDSNGDIPAYDFTGKMSDGRQIDISITKQGGSLLWLMTQATGNESGVPDKSTTQSYERMAQDFLKKHDYNDMRSTYAQYYDGVALINFAATQDDVILYNDLIKVWVDRATGEIIGCDARNYLYSHVKRDIEKAEISRDDAKLLISENLDVKQIRLALIPVTPETEVLCYEFKGSYGGESFIVYINALNGEEQQIFRIINTDEGELVL